MSWRGKRRIDNVENRRGMSIWTAEALVFYFFQRVSLDVGGYTLVYYKNRCNNEPQTLPGELGLINKTTGNRRC